MIKEEIILNKPYKIMRIGHNMWMCENLGIASHLLGKRWNNGVYGVLYDWQAARNLMLENGWRLPNNDDFNNVKVIPDGFNIQLGGSCNSNGIIQGIGKMGNWWSDIEFNDVSAYYRYLEGNDDINGFTRARALDKTIGCSIRLVRSLRMDEYNDDEILDELEKRGYKIEKPSPKVLKKTIVDPLDLFKYSIALVNSGVTYESIEVLERQILPLLFGVNGAERLLEYLAGNTTKEKTEPLPTDDTYDFSGNTEVPRIIYNYGEVDELIKGDGKLFAGLKALLATLICTNLLSQNRVQVARQNVTKQPTNSRQTNRKEDSEVVQALCFTAHSIICAMARYLTKEGKNPLKLDVRGIIEATRYSVNVSGKMPSNWLNIWGWF